MEFEYTSSICILERDLDRMAECVRAGKNFNWVFDSILTSYDDEDYYNRGLIADAVEKEVMKRVNGED